MNTQTNRVVKTYITLTLLSTFAASFIWGINTLFLLDAGLSNTEAFAANAFFTLGMVVFEVPTGVVADTWGRRASYLLGSITLFFSTLLYLWMWQSMADLWLWALASMFIGLGFTFYSGATEAWLVDALNHNKYKGNLDSVFAKGQISSGIAMLTGSIAGGVIAQMTNLGVPFILRAVMLGLAFTAAWFLMKDEGFIPKKASNIRAEIKTIVARSVEHGWKKPSMRWLMISAPFSAGVGIYAFYAMQPYLLELYGDPTAYGVAGLAAAIVAGAQVAGGLSVNALIKRVKKRTSILMGGVVVSTLVLVLIGVTNVFAVAVGLLVVWALVFAATMPVRQSYVNALIPSEQRATILSFDSLMSSSGGIITQPALGKVADVYSYSASYIISAIVQIIALPFIYLSRTQKAKADLIQK